MKKIVFIGSVLLLLIACGKQEQPDVSADARLNLANAYYTNGLYEASVQEYLTYLDSYPLKEARRANTYFTIANIYFERLHDYEKALEYYFKVKYLYPQSTLQTEVGKKLVNCLERLQKSGDAQRIYEKEAALDKNKVKENRPGQVLAQTSTKKFTQGDLDFEISEMPVYMRDTFKDKKKKEELLQQMVLQELLYDSAKRKGLDKDKDVLEGAFRAKKGLMADKLLKQELKDKVKIEAKDVELYYEAHKDNYTEKDKKGKVTRQKPLREVQQQVARDLSMERQQQAYQELAQRLMQAEDVKFFNDKIR